MGGLRQNLLLALLALLLLAWFWAPNLDTPLDQRAAARQQPSVTTYLTDSRSQAYNEAGQLVEILAAERIAYRDVDDTSELSQPRYYAHDGDDRSWSLVAQRGTLRHATEILSLNQDILLTNDQSGGTLATRALTLNLRSKTATSMVPVTFTQANNRVTADGMRADLTAQVIHLEPNVESLYVPPGQ